MSTQIFFKNLIKHWVTVRTLLKSDNFMFLTFAIPGHFYSPIPDLLEIQNESVEIFNRSPKSLPAIAINEETQIGLVTEFSRFQKEISFPEKKAPNYRYYLDNAYFSYGDGVALYSFMRHFRPKRIVEVGSGFSSALMLDVNERYFDGDIKFTFIEPYPDRLFPLLSDRDRQLHEVVTRVVQQVDSNIFNNLNEGDILFIDSSHVAKTHSDVLHILFNVLPNLKNGVIVHFHDILWPFEYPESWITAGRAWNEAYFLRVFLQYNPIFEILFFNSYMELHQREILEKDMPLTLKTPSSTVTPGNTSLWLRKIR
jgi:hypothetical protein